jgi:hypothetical protein
MTQALSALRQRLAPAWPHLRTLFIAFHVAAIVALSLPTSRVLLDRSGWESENTRTELVRWSERLGRLGVETTPAGLEQTVRRLIGRYVGVHAVLTAPFARYARFTGATQGWAMFAAPQKHPAELHIDILEGHTWRPIYRPHSAEHDFWGPRFRHNRMRKQLGRFARTFHTGVYDRLAQFVAREAALAYPGARAIRVRLWRYATLAPEAVRAGQTPVGRYEQARRFNAETLRRGARP